MIKPPPFALDDVDRNSLLWPKLMAHFEDQLRKCRLANDDPKDAEATASLRGEIKAYKHMLTLNNRPKATPSD